MFQWNFVAALFCLVGCVLFPSRCGYCNWGVRQYQSSLVLVLLLLFLGAAPSVLLAASAGRSIASRTVFGQERITLKTSNSPPVVLSVEVVDLALRPEGGLRRTLPENGGLLWLYPQVTDQPLEARSNGVPVSVALFDRNGVILQILELEPCNTRCPRLFPKVAYRGRLEVAGGWFAQHGIGVGSQIEAASIRALKASAE